MVIFAELKCVDGFVHNKRIESEVLVVVVYDGGCAVIIVAGSWHHVVSADVAVARYKRTRVARAVVCHKVVVSVDCCIAIVVVKEHVVANHILVAVGDAPLDDTILYNAVSGALKVYVASYYTVLHIDSLNGAVVAVISYVSVYFHVFQRNILNSVCRIAVVKISVDVHSFDREVVGAFA